MHLGADVPMIVGRINGFHKSLVKEDYCAFVEDLNTQLYPLKSCVPLLHTQQVSLSTSAMFDPDLVDPLPESNKSEIVL